MLLASQVADGFWDPMGPNGFVSNRSQAARLLSSRPENIAGSRLTSWDASLPQDVGRCQIGLLEAQQAGPSSACHALSAAELCLEIW